MNHRIKQKEKAYVCLIIVLAMVLPVRAQHDDVSTYDIPANAIKRGPYTDIDPYKETYEYFVSKADGTRGALIGLETYDHSVLSQRQLFKNGKKHGVQREWHRNGQLASEAPYRNGVRDGLFKHWDAKGQLVGQYQMNNGNGVLKIYNSNGVLTEEENYDNNRENGLDMEYFADTGVRSLVWFKNGKMVGKGYSFYDDKNLRSLGFLSDTGSLHGPFLEFDRKTTEIDNKVTEGQSPSNDHKPGFTGFSAQGAPGGVRKVWYVKGRKVSEEEYVKAAAGDPNLPPYYGDVTKYESFVTPEVKTLLEHYRTLPRVKIPLAFDAQGNPILAPVLPSSAPSQPK